MEIENFFYNDKFFNDFEEFVESIHNESELSIVDLLNEIESGSDYEVEMSDFRHLKEYNLEYMTELIFERDCDDLCDLVDYSEKRYESEIKEALLASVDFKKLQSLMPKFYSTNSKKAVISKLYVMKYIEQNYKY